MDLSSVPCFAAMLQVGCATATPAVASSPARMVAKALRKNGGGGICFMVMSPKLSCLLSECTGFTRKMQVCVLVQYI